MLYTIEEETLNGLADAIRLKTIGNTGTDNILVVEPFKIDYWYGSFFELPSYVKKVKITGYIDYGTGENVNGIKGLYIVPEKNTNPPSVPEHPDCIVLQEKISEPVDDLTIYNSNFEVMIESNTWTFSYGFIGSGAEITLNFTAIGLDENGNEFRYTPLEMIDEINGLDIIPEEGYNITGNCQYRFAYNGWNWFVEDYGSGVNTNNISNIDHMFYSSNKLTNIPFDINITNTATNTSQCFAMCNKLINVPYIIGTERKAPTGSYNGCLGLSMFFYSCYNLREIPYDYFWKMVPNEDFWEAHKKYFQSGDSLFQNCYSLRELPDISMLVTGGSSTYGSLYSSFINECASLNKANNIPVSSATYTSNMFSQICNNCYRIKDFTFEINEDGTPKTANWKSQTIDMTKQTGYTNTPSKILNYNSGITADKEVKDDATYQALKDDPDWFSRDINYSRYNHDSAINTINSLPDTSAYGTNTIKFKGACGALTDGGAINTLTEEEIAVAAAKGWTVSLS